MRILCLHGRGSNNKVSPLQVCTKTQLAIKQCYSGECITVAGSSKRKANIWRHTIFPGLRTTNRSVFLPLLSRQGPLTSFDLKWRTEVPRYHLCHIDWYLQPPCDINWEQSSMNTSSLRGKYHVPQPLVSYFVLATAAYGVWPYTVAPAAYHHLPALLA